MRLSVPFFFIVLSCVVSVRCPKVWDIEAPKILMIWSPAKQQFLGTVSGWWGPSVRGSFVGMFELLVCWDGIWVGISKRQLVFIFFPVGMGEVGCMFCCD